MSGYSGHSRGMNKGWESELKSLQTEQEELRSRMQSIDARLSVLQHRLEFAEAPDVSAAVVVDPPGNGMEFQKERCDGDESPLIDPPRTAVPPPLPDLEKPACDPLAGSNGDVRDAGDSLEMRVGRFWLVRVGIFVLLTGFVLLGNLAYHSMIAPLGAPGKLGVMAMVGGLLAALGSVLHRRMPSVRNYANVLMAGGAATIYYTAYAAHFVEPLRVIASPVLGGAILLFLAGALAWIADRQRSQGIAFTAILLSYYTAAINPASEFTVFSNAVLTIAALLLLIRRGWIAVSWLGLAGSYGGYAYWRWRGGGLNFSDSVDSGTVVAALSILAAYWILFAFAVFARRAAALPSPTRNVFLTLNNVAFFLLAAPQVATAFPQAYWLGCFGFGGLLVFLSVLAHRIRPQEQGFDGAWLAQGILALSVGLCARFTGADLAILFLIQGLALEFVSRHRHRLLVGTLSVLSSSAGFFLVLFALAGDGPNVWITACAGGVLLCLNAYLLKRGAEAVRLETLEWRPGLFSAAGSLLFGIVAITELSGNSRVLVLAAGAVLLTGLFRVHRLFELAVCAQGFLAASIVALWAVTSAESVTWTNAFPCLVAALVLMHWWQRRPAVYATIPETLDAAASCFVVFLWIIAPWDGPWQMFRLTAVGGAVLAYGLVTRSWPLAVLSQVFTLAGAASSLREMVSGSPPLASVLLTYACVALQAASWRFVRVADQSGFRNAAAILRVAALAMGIGGVFEFVPSPYRFLILTAAAGLVAVIGLTRGWRECLFHAAVLAAAGVTWYLARLLSPLVSPGADALALVLLMFLPQATRLNAGTTAEFPAWTRIGIACGGMAGLWIQASRWSWDGDGGIAVTIVWAVLAFAFLGSGFLLRERSFRLMGFVVLAVAVGHVFFVDVWKLGQLAGIMGMIALALVLLALGFIYNRFADRIRKWL